jgi:tetratricopeptide (TPR) repeat protein
MKPKIGINNIKLISVSVLLIVLTLITYWQVKNYAFINYDDDKYITENRHVITGLKLDNIKWAFQSTYASNWHPLAWLSLMVDAQLFGLNAGYYHLTNLFLHILNTLLLLLILYKMTGALGRSTLVAALFALHPLHIESVAWVTERKDVLSMFFMLLTLWAYIHYIQKPDYKRYSLIFVAFALGLMTKPILVTLPFVLLLLDYWPLQRFSLRNEKNIDSVLTTKTAAALIYEKIPLFFLTGLSIALTIIAQRAEIEFMQSIPALLRVENALVAYCGYIFKMIWPVSLGVLYPHSAYIPLWKVSVSAILLATVSGIAIYTIKKMPYIAVGWFWYLGTMVPVIGIVQVGVQSMADRYTYIPLIGLFIILAWFLSDALEKIPYKKYIIATVSAVIVLLLVTLSWSQLKYWKNSHELLTHTLEVTRDNYTMHCNLAVLLAGQGDSKAAEFHYLEALKINPDDKDTNINFGNLLVRQGRLDEAIERYINAIKSKPNFAKAYNNLGIAYVQRGDRQKAIEQFSTAVKINPSYLDAQNNLKMALLQKQVKESASTKQSADSEDISTFSGQMMVGTSLMKKGDLDGAIKHFQEALKIEPENINAHVSMGLALGYKRNFDGAISHFRTAIKINPRIPEIYNSLAVALAYTGKTDKAIAQLNKALEINPRFAKAHNSLGVMLAKSGKFDEGIDHLRKAIEIDPEYTEAKKNLDLVLSMKK